MLIRIGETHSYTKEELKTILGINIAMAINELSTIGEYWRADNLVGNDGIQNTMVSKHFCETLKNQHFTDNRKVDKTEKVFKMRPVIEHLSSKFSEVLSNHREQNIDENLVKCKGRSI